MVILEILEHGRIQHSDARSIPDADRELQTRRSLQSLPIFYVYMSIANNTYHRAHRDDIFFTKTKDDREYILIPERKSAWRIRIKKLLSLLLEGEVQRSNDTRWIGF
jgi:hypothetical protein